MHPESPFYLLQLYLPLLFVCKEIKSHLAQHDSLIYLNIINILFLFPPLFYILTFQESEIVFLNVVHLKFFYTCGSSEL